jgi:2-polyprenyl-6-methoxyphenol hydroxylase-like FAD-dependent oxidoreductase
MRIAVVGAGPGGLYFSARWKRRHPQDEVRVYEQNPADATFGFGVVFSDRALAFLREDDPQICQLITSCMETWQDMTLVHRGESITLDGVGFSAIGRLQLLQILQQTAAAAGAELFFDRPIGSLNELAGADLIVGADGINSLVRRSFAADFATSLSYMDNKFIWYGTTKPFETLTQTFVETEHGAFNAHHYRYAPAMSTFIIECNRSTWDRTGFAAMRPEATKSYCETIFARALAGRALVSNKSVWRNFPRLWNDRWFHQNVVLVGDALHTAHFSIGSGTRLALEDVIALVGALESAPHDLRAALHAYEANRRPIVEKITTAANASAQWYTTFADHMQLSPLDFAYSYITRSGRINDDRLRAIAPKFMAYYQANRSTQPTLMANRAR